MYSTQSHILSSLSQGLQYLTLPAQDGNQKTLQQLQERALLAHSEAKYCLKSYCFIKFDILHFTTNISEQ